MHTRTLLNSVIAATVLFVSTSAGPCAVRPVSSVLGTGTTTSQTAPALSSTIVSSSNTEDYSIPGTSTTSDIASTTNVLSSTASKTVTYTNVQSTTDVASTTTILSTEVPSRTDIASTTVPDSTTSLPPVLETFSLQGGNSDNTNANGQTLQWRSGGGWILYLQVPSASAANWNPAQFFLEESTNRLMAGAGVYVFTTPTRALYTGTTGYIARGNSYVTCDSLIREGVPLSCVVEGTTRTQFSVGSTSTTTMALYLQEPGLTGYTAVDIVPS